MNGAGKPRRDPMPRSVPESLFLPRVAAHVIAAVLPLFPEAGLIAFHQLDAAYPLGTFPGIQAWHHQAQRVTVIRLEVLTVVPPGEQAVVAEEIVERQIRREAVLAVDHDKPGMRMHLHLA